MPWEYRSHSVKMGGLHDRWSLLTRKVKEMTIPETYYNGINRRDFEQVAHVLAEDIEFVGALGSTYGIDACIEGLRSLRDEIERFEIVHVWDDSEGNIATWFALHVEGIDPVPGVNWMRVRDGKIVKEQAVFDPRTFIEAMSRKRG